MTYITDAQVDRACATLRKAINAAENSNHAGEMFVIAAAEAPAMAEALRYVTDHLVSELGELADEDGTPDDQLGPWLGHEYAKQVINARLRIRQARAILARIGEA